jgi:two-component system cell cycle sensor histidine kinase/response regulator CckA
VPLLGPDGQLEQIVVSFVDFTARRKAETALRQREEQLRQAQKMEALGRLAGGIAHDFNNLLTIINGYSELLLANLPPDHPHHAFIAEIASAGERAAAITSQLLAVSRRQVLAPTVLDLNVIVADTQALLRRLIGEDIQLTVTLRHGLAPVRADPGQLQQVLLNLALNARDAMPHGGCLALETTEATLAAPLAHPHGVVPPGTYVLLRVRDSGVGVAPDVLPHLFEPFFTTKERGAGTGLGLATVYGIVAQSGGHIVVDSAPGQGTTVTVYLPPARATEAAAPPAATTALPPRGTETILLVEDDSQVRTLARTMLAACGYTVLVAASGEEALRLAAAYDGPLHLLLTDVVMPGLSGPELAARLVAERPGLPVLYISGYTDDRLERHGLPNATTAFLSKPFTAEALARAVRQVLDIGRC